MSVFRRTTKRHGSHRRTTKPREKGNKEAKLPNREANNKEAKLQRKKAQARQDLPHERQARQSEHQAAKYFAMILFVFKPPREEFIKHK